MEIHKKYDLLDNFPSDRGIIFCDETEKKETFNNFLTLKKNINTILIGPEGGFSPSEKNFLKSLNYVYGLSLGERILRADTAAISALTLFIHKKK